MDGFHQPDQWEQAYWRLRPDDPPNEKWRVPLGSSGAHLYAYGDPDRPRCDLPLNRRDTRPAAFGDSLCWPCFRWYAFEVDLPAHA